MKVICQYSCPFSPSYSQTLKLFNIFEIWCREKKSVIMNSIVWCEFLKFETVVSLGTNYSPKTKHSSFILIFGAEENKSVKLDLMKSVSNVYYSSTKLVPQNKSFSIFSKISYREHINHAKFHGDNQVSG